jgi:type II secretory pathway component PulL
MKTQFPESDPKAEKLNSLFPHAKKKKKKKKKKKNTNKQKDKYKNKAKKQYCATFPNQQSRIRNTTHWKSRKSAEHEDKNQINHSHDPTCLIIQKRNKIVQREFQSKDSC